MQTATGLCLAIACAMGITATHSMAESQILEEIIVTAQRRAQAENTVGIAMTVFGDEAIDELRIENSLDVSMYTPGFTITNAGGASVPVYTLRGVGFDDHQPNSSATVGVYSDEVALPYPIMTMGLRHDLERIEVLKGPQGDLYGRNNTGGALNYISNGPTDIASAGISLGAANYQTLDVNGFANGPLGDRVNGRLAGAAKSRNKGWQENELTDQAVGAYDEYSLRGMLDITASDTVDIFVNLHGGRYKGDPQVPQSTVVLPSSNQTAAFLNSIGLYPIASLDPLMVADQDDPQATRWNQDPYHKTTHVGGSVIVDWKIGDAKLTSITGYDEFERDVNLDWDGTPARLLEVSAETQIDSFTQEVRFASDDQGPLTWLGGLYFSKDTVNDSSAYDDSESPTVGFTFGSQADQSTEAAAAFGHTQWQFARQFKLNLGARYTSETRSIENCTTDTGDGTAAGALMTFQALGMLTLTNPQALVPGGCVHLKAQERAAIHRPPMSVCRACTQIRSKPTKSPARWAWTGSPATTGSSTAASAAVSNPAVTTCSRHSWWTSSSLTKKKSSPLSKSDSKGTC